MIVHGMLGSSRHKGLMPSSRAPPQLRAVSLSNPLAVAEWCQHFKCTVLELSVAVGVVGSEPDAVAKHLQSQAAADSVDWPAG